MNPVVAISCNKWCKGTKEALQVGLTPHSYNDESVGWVSYCSVHQPLSGEINADRARRKVRIPVVLTREETARVIARMSRVHQLVVKLLYGSGLRITECLRLWIQDMDLDECRLLPVSSSFGRLASGDEENVLGLR